jgi:hypothetical protein
MSLSAKPGCHCKHPEWRPWPAKPAPPVHRGGCGSHYGVGSPATARAYTKQCATPVALVASWCPQKTVTASPGLRFPVCETLQAPQATRSELLSNSVSWAAGPGATMVASRAGRLCDCSHVCELVGNGLFPQDTVKPRVHVNMGECCGQSSLPLRGTNCKTAACYTGCLCHLLAASANSSQWRALLEGGPNCWRGRWTLASLLDL